MEELILALDFGGTKHTAGVIERGSSIWRSLERAYSGERPNAARDVEIMLDLAHRALEGKQPQVTGVSFGGPVDFSTAIVRLSHHVEGWEAFPLGAYLSERLGVIAVIDNDANAAALGEWKYGAGRGCQSLLYVTVSTGVGAGWIIRGTPWRGADSMAGEIGHTIVEPGGPECLCGKRGCVERLVSGPYMAGDAIQLLRNEPERGAFLRLLASQSGGKIDGKILAEAAEQGDDVAVQVLRRGAFALGMALGNAANLINPEIIILGGGIGKSGVMFWEPLFDAMENTRLPQVTTRVLPTALGDEAPLWGAVALAESAI